MSAKGIVLRRFVVLTMQRSGSTWFIDLLNSTDGVRAFGEIFLDVERARHEKKWNKHLLPQLRYHDFQSVSTNRKLGSAIKYLDYLFGTETEKQVVGFKLMWSQLWEHPGVLYYMVTRHCSVIYLERENSLEQVLSSEIARSRKIYHSTGEIERKPVRVDCGGVVEQVRKFERRKKIIRMLLKWLPNPVIRVPYEMLRMSPDAAVDMVSDFLGVPRSSNTVHSRFKKISGDDVLNQVENAMELRSAFERNGLGKLLP